LLIFLIKKFIGAEMVAQIAQTEKKNIKIKINTVYTKKSNKASIRYIIQVL